ncbi:hypothetical protein Lal_00047727 [Lupinus albus]|nr:hypothetical protein Lal_00047727 [Lupinus albus]
MTCGLACGLARVMSTSLAKDAQSDLGSQRIWCSTRIRLAWSWRIRLSRSGKVLAHQVVSVIQSIGTSGPSYMCINIMFGKEVESQITLNLPINRISSQIAIYTTLVNPISKYALMVTPITNALKALLPQQYKKDKLTSILINTILVISTVIIAITVPFFAYLTSLVGAFLSITASIILMCSCYLKISGTYNKLGIETVAIMTIIFLGVVVGIFGTYTSLLEIINHL